MAYEAVIRKIPRAWQEKINANTDICINLKYNVQINPYIKFILKDEKGCRSIYDKIVSVNQLLLTNKWTTELGDITSEEMKVYKRNLKYVKEIKLRDFQFKINHRILVTNSFLLKIKKKETDLCSYCHKESESIMHLFARCDLVKEFWENFKRWLTDKINTTLEINDKNILFSSFSKCSLIRYK